MCFRHRSFFTTHIQELCRVYTIFALFSFITVISVFETHSIFRPSLINSAMPAPFHQLVKHCTAAAASPAPTAQTKLESDLLFLLLPSQRVGAGGPLRHGGGQMNTAIDHSHYFLIFEIFIRFTVIRGAIGACIASVCYLPCLKQTVF
jgi:hypothetical protein